MNYFNTGTLRCILFMSLIIVLVSFFLRVCKKESKNSLYFFVSSIWVFITVIFLYILVLILPKDKIVSSIKCIDYETVNRNVVAIQEYQDEKIYQIKIIKDKECDIPYLEAKTTSVVLETLPIFEVEEDTQYILHMPEKKEIDKQPSN